MCDPVSAATMASAAQGMQIAGTVAGAYGAYNQSKATKQSLEYQSAVARNNAEYSESQARDAIRRGQVAENDVRRRTAQLEGSQRARLAANGIDLGEGSALNILMDTAFFGENDALNVRDNSNREATAFRTQASNQIGNANLMDARAGMESPMGAAATTLLTGAGAVASSWYRNKSPVTADYSLPSQPSLGFKVR
ncbi:MAG: virion core protein, T7 gp14 family [Plesiomonas shigelloides]